MPHAVHSDDQKTMTSKKMSIEQRARSVPYKRAFVVAVITTLLFYLGIIALTTCVVIFFTAPAELKQGAGYTFALIMPAAAFFWVISYFKRRKATCPLCKCTPFLDNLAHKHQKSFRLRPLNYGTTAILNTVFTQRWRCMYCGTPFDLLKLKKGSEELAPKKTKKRTQKK